MEAAAYKVHVATGDVTAFREGPCPVLTSATTGIAETAGVAKDRASKDPSGSPIFGANGLRTTGRVRAFRSAMDRPFPTALLVPSVVILLPTSTPVLQVGPRATAKAGQELLALL